MFAKLFHRRRYRLRLVKLYIDRNYFIRLRGDWEIVEHYPDSTRVVARLENFACFQARRACRIWNRFAK